MFDDEYTPAPAAQEASPGARAIADLALGLHAVAQSLAEAAGQLDHLEVAAREALRRDLERWLADLGDACHEARQAVRGVTDE